jgi:hypothetical protein
VDEVLGVDGKGMPTKEITDTFVDAANCPEMADKIKIFLFQVRAAII